MAQNSSEGVDHTEVPMEQGYLNVAEVIYGTPQIPRTYEELLAIATTVREVIIGEVVCDALLIVNGGQISGPRPNALRDRRAFRLRFGIEDGVSRTLEKTGEVIGVSRGRMG